MVGVVVAAGRSSRLGDSVRKQFQDLGGHTLVARSIFALSLRPGVESVVVVLPAEEIGGARAGVIERLPGVGAVVAGGPTRARSVKQGLDAAPEARHVLVHDAARPLARPALVDSVIQATLRHGAAVPALPIRDTVKEVDGAGSLARTLDRARLYVTQTPQGSRADWLREALERAEREGVEPSDESCALEWAGRRVVLVPGDPGNLKITDLEDLEEARRRLTGFAAALRVGTGFDVHRFGADRPLVLAGVTLPGEPGLHGHSDADVVLHAAMDSLLGAAALGDIGTHFPPSDPRLAGVASTEMAARVARLLAEAGYEIVNLDLTLLAERPQVQQHVEEMRAATAACLGVAREQVSLKATTLEGLGALGRAEGIACQAVALVRRQEELL